MIIMWVETLLATSCRPSAETSQSDVLNDGREGVGSNSVALHFCLNPPRDYLGNLRLFSNILVVTICDHGGIYPGWTMGQPPNRRLSSARSFSPPMSSFIRRKPVPDT